MVDPGGPQPVANDEFAASVKKPQVRASDAVIHVDICALYAAEHSTVPDMGARRTDTRMAPLMEDEQWDDCGAKERGRDEAKDRARGPNDEPNPVGHARMLVRWVLPAKGRRSQWEGRSGPTLSVTTR